MSGFHEVRFPLRLALGATGGPVRRTDIVNLSNGREQRNQRWRDSRRSYDAGSGVKSLRDLYAVLEFFEARGGQLHGFRFRDPVDWKSCAPGEAVSATDQVIGTGDGAAATFQLVKTYADSGGSWMRRIVKPVSGTVAVSVNEGEQAPGAFPSMRRRVLSPLRPGMFRASGLWCGPVTSSTCRCGSIRTGSRSTSRISMPGAFRPYS